MEGDLKNHLGACILSYLQYTGEHLKQSEESDDVESRGKRPTALPWRAGEKGMCSAWKADIFDYSEI